VTLVADSARLGWREALTQYIDKGHRSFAKRLSDLALGNWHLLLLRDRAGRALDIGCGFGSLTLGLGEYYSYALGVDILRERLAYASLRTQQDHRDQSRFTQTNAHQLPLKTGTFDLVTMNGVLEWAALHARGEPRALQRAMLLEARRVLKPDGVIAIAIENRYALEQLVGMPDTHTGLRFVTTLPRVVANGVSRVRFGRSYTTYLHSRSGYKMLLQEAGFPDVCILDLISSYNDYDFIASPDDDATYRFLWRQNVVRSFVPWTGPARRLLAKVRPRWLGRCNYAYLVFAGNRVATPLDPAHPLWDAARSWGVEPGRARFACRSGVPGAIAIVSHDGERVTGIVEYGSSPALAVRDASASPSLVTRQLAGDVTLAGKGEVRGLMARAYRPRRVLLPGHAHAS
jgi:SAM-dependent methyltransferase